MKVAPDSSAAVSSASNAAAWLVLAVAGVPLSLIYDFSWESTVGIDRFWALPHTLTYLSVALAGTISVALVIRSRFGSGHDVRLGSFHAPLGAWLVLWGTLAFVTALVFDRWWQSAYGMGAGIWHPPQLLKATAFFAVIIGAWLLSARAQNHESATKFGVTQFPMAGGLILALITIVALPSHYPNQQHSSSFYRLACATYPFVLAILARAGRMRWPATLAAIFYTFMFCVCIWLLPLVPARPEVGPIYNPMDHLMPPPFPLLLIIPAFAMDLLMKKISRADDWLRALAMGAAFFLSFLCVQWVFSEFLLMNLADNWFFAGGGKHWPFFLKINPAGRTNFWESPADAMNWANALIALGFAVLATRLGLWVGTWMAKVQR